MLDDIKQGLKRATALIVHVLNNLGDNRGHKMYERQVKSPTNLKLGVRVGDVFEFVHGLLTAGPVSR